jgi:hypothetical protein
MQIEVFTQDFAVAEEIQNSVPSGISISRLDKLTRSLNDPGWIILTLEFIRDKSIEIDIAIFAAWLYDKTKNDKTCQIRNGRKDIVKSEEGIRRWIQEELDIGDKDKDGN